MATMCAVETGSLTGNRPWGGHLRMVQVMNIFGRILEISTRPAFTLPPLDYGFVLGDDQYENPAVFTPATDGHLALTGGAGTGKTVLLRALVEEVAQIMDVHIADSWYAVDHDPGAVPEFIASFTGSAAGCAAMLRSVRDEVRRRVQLCEATGGTFEGLPNARRILVILDDTRHMLADDGYSPAGDRDAKAQSRSDIAEIALSASLAGVTFVFSSQWPATESLIPADVLASEVSRLALRTFTLDPVGDGADYRRYRDGLYMRPGFDETRIMIDPR